ncbi:MAG: hypothetical protein II768_09840 [Clostridia bacterium]|nr:hypothetical protein [Clostridia bacterium]
MEQHRVMGVLSAVLAAACVILAVLLVRVTRARDYLPESEIADLVAVLAESGIEVDPSLVTTKRQSAAVYVCNSGDYSATVAGLLTGSAPARTYVVPDGEILITEDGERMEFYGDFSFRYSADGSSPGQMRAFGPTLSSHAVSDERRARIEETVAGFLARGSRTFEGIGSMEVETVVENVWEDGRMCYALCSRTIDGVQVTGNRVLCAVEGDRVAEAWGNWCFFTPAVPYTAQLTDLFNILFNMKKEIGTAEGGVRVESVSLCYSLYFYGEEEDFCLIPCWQVVTDTMGSFIFNALDGALYTRT